MQLFPAILALLLCASCTPALGAGQGCTFSLISTNSTSISMTAIQADNNGPEYPETTYISQDGNLLAQGGNYRTLIAASVEQQFEIELDPSGTVTRCEAHTIDEGEWTIIFGEAPGAQMPSFSGLAKVGSSHFENYTGTNDDYMLVDVAGGCLPVLIGDSRGVDMVYTDITYGLPVPPNAFEIPTQCFAEGAEVLKAAGPKARRPFGGLAKMHGPGHVVV